MYVRSVYGNNVSQMRMNEHLWRQVVYILCFPAFFGVLTSFFESFRACLFFERYGMAWYGMVWYGMPRFCLVSGETQAIHWQKYITTGLPVSDTEVSFSL